MTARNKFFGQSSCGSCSLWVVAVEREPENILSSVLDSQKQPAITIALNHETKARNTDPAVPDDQGYGYDWQLRSGLPLARKAGTVRNQISNSVTADFSCVQSPVDKGKDFGIDSERREGVMNLHPGPLYQPIPVKDVIPRSLGTRSERINPWIPADEPAMRAIS